WRRAGWVFGSGAVDGCRAGARVLSFPDGIGTVDGGTAVALRPFGPELTSPCTSAPLTATASAARTATIARRRSGGSAKRGFRDGRSRAATSSTRWRSFDEATGRAARNCDASSGDSMCVHHPFQLLERTAQPRRASALTDSENAGGHLSVELEHDPQRDDFAFCPGQLSERVLELGGEVFAKARRR